MPFPLHLTRPRRLPSYNVNMDVAPNQHGIGMFLFQGLESLPDTETEGTFEPGLFCTKLLYCTPSFPTLVFNCSYEVRK
jgi:hypothetical protein